MMTKKSIYSATDEQWCDYLECRYGMILALEIYAQFNETDGTAPAEFQTYAALKQMEQASHGAFAQRLAA